MSTFTETLQQAIANMSTSDYNTQKQELQRQLELANLQRQIKEAQEWTWEREATIQSGIDPVLSASYQQSTKTLVDVLQGQTTNQPSVYVQPAVTSSTNYLLWVGIAAAVYFLFIRKR